MAVGSVIIHRIRVFIERVNVCSSKQPDYAEQWTASGWTKTTDDLARLVRQLVHDRQDYKDRHEGHGELPCQRR